MAFRLGGGSMDDKDLIDKLYLLERQDFLQLSNKEIAEENKEDKVKKATKKKDAKNN